MRHSDIGLTMNVYTDLRLLDIAGAIDLLPQRPINDPDDKHQETVIRRTGIDDARTVPPMFAPKSDNQCKSLSIVGNSDELLNDTKNEENPEKHYVSRGFSKSGRLDLNQRPLRPERSALPGCATPRKQIVCSE